MLIGLYADPHFSQNSSIIVGRKGSFTGRLDNLIKSFKWMNTLFKDQGVETVICLGDMTDKPNLTSEEITALSQCDIFDHLLLIGNHCRSDKSGKINSLSLFKNIIYEPTTIVRDSCSILLLPYSTEVFDLSSLYEKPDIILSHNDIYGYDYGGGHISTSGYPINQILDNCKLFINGHLHNGGWIVKDRIMNLGILSGMNFSSCNGEWEPSVAILDTNSLNIKLYENPEAYRFRKVSFDNLFKLKTFLDELPSNKYVVQVKVPKKIAQETRKLLDQSNKVVSSRVITVQEPSEVSQVSQRVTELESDKRTIYNKFRDFISSTKPTYDMKILNKIINDIESQEGIE